MLMDLRNVFKKGLKTKFPALIIITSLLISGLPFIFDLNTESSVIKAEIITVNTNGSADFKSIQAAINAAKPGDTIRIKAGYYFENLTVKKTIELIGSEAEQTIIFGNWSEKVVTINANRCNITNLTITGYYSYSLLFINANNTVITNCHFIGGVIGLDLREANYNLIDNCICKANSGAGMYFGGAMDNTIVNTSCINSTYGPGIYFWYSFRNHFLNGSCDGNAEDGIYAYWLSNDNIFKNYTFNYNQGSGVHLFDSDRFILDNCISKGNGVNGFIISSTGNKFTNCTSTSNGADGFYMYHSEGSEIRNCISWQNGGRGFYLKYSDKNMITKNSIISNVDLGIKLDGNSKNNKIYSNDLINNNNGICQAHDAGGGNEWYKDGWGNYWWDYRYHYPNASQVGHVWSTAYDISVSNNVRDEHPLLNPTILTVDLEQFHPGINNDTDSDGVFDLIDALPYDENEWMDTDRDRVGNNVDTDDDNDGVPDFDEISNGTNPLSNDTDGDGHNDHQDVFPLDPEKWTLTEPVPEKNDEKDQPDSVWLWIGIILIFSIVVIVMIKLFVSSLDLEKNKK